MIGTVTPNAILLNISPPFLGQEANTVSRNIPWKWFVNEFLVDMVAILLDNKKLEAEGRKLKVLNVTVCRVLFFVFCIYYLI